MWLQISFILIHYYLNNWQLTSQLLQSQPTGNRQISVRVTLHMRISKQQGENAVWSISPCLISPDSNNQFNKWRQFDLWKKKSLKSCHSQEAQLYSHEWRDGCYGNQVLSDSLHTECVLRKLIEKFPDRLVLFHCGWLSWLLINVSWNNAWGKCCYSTY